MSNIFFILGMVSIVVVVLSLIIGILAMTDETRKSGKLSNRLMTLRVAAQGTAVVFLLLAYLAK